MNAFPTNGLVIDAEEIYQDPEFAAWLNKRQPFFTITEDNKGYFPDLVVLVDPSLEGEGSDSDMPEHIWNQIIDACRDNFGPSDGPHIMVMLRQE